MVTDIISPGDKIDIKFLHQNVGKTYRSNVFDFISETELEIGMPTEGGKLVLFNVGFSGQFYFYTQKGIFTCEAVVTDRYRKENFALLVIRLKSILKKFQRRDYFRVDYYEEFTYYPTDKSILELETLEDVAKEVSSVEYILKQQSGRAQDLSGGGIRFIANEPIEIGSYIVTVLKLKNEKMDKTFYLPTEIIACDPIEKVPEKKMIRAKFIFKDLNDRELIIKYVFERDRYLRKKENG